MSWWQSDKHIQQIVDWAYEMQDRFPDEHLVSIGQSPAWILRTVSMIRKMRGEKVNLTYVPFTGGFVTRDKSEDACLKDEMIFGPKAEWERNQSELPYYYDFLKNLNMHPDQLMARMASGEKLVFAEMIIGANGLASFLNIILNQQSSEFKTLFSSHAKVFVYDTAPKGNKDFVRLMDGDLVELEREAMNQEEADMIKNIAPMNVVETSSTRLVPTYRLAFYGREAPGFRLIPNRYMRKIIEEKLHDVVQYREHHL